MALGGNESDRGRHRGWGVAPGKTAEPLMHWERRRGAKKLGGVGAGEADRASLFLEGQVYEAY